MLFSALKSDILTRETICFWSQPQFEGLQILARSCRFIFQLLGVQFELIPHETKRQDLI